MEKGYRREPIPDSHRRGKCDLGDIFYLAFVKPKLELKKGGNHDFS